MTENNQEKTIRWEREIEQRLGRLPLARRYYDQTDSTNTRAKQFVIDGGRGAAVFVADSQTQGRGRMGRSFFSPGDTGVYLSLLFPVQGSLSDAVLLTSGAAVATARAIEKSIGIRVGIKWVNDLYFRGRKVCGILAESFLWEGERYVILGVGINLNTVDFPHELKNIAGSLTEGADGDRVLLTACLIEHLYEMMTVWEPKDWMEEYRSRSTVIGQPVTYWIDGTEYRGQAVAIEDDGALLVICEDGRRERLTSGEITLRMTEKGGLAHE
jgi:BirA family biotin operon repressor/biotin-[acetyl-CoA-carboxylase] ligase